MGRQAAWVLMARDFLLLGGDVLSAETRGS